MPHPVIRRSARPLGQSLAEFVLILPVLLLLLLTAIDLGRLMYAQITITNAAKEGALVASQGGSFQSGLACSSSNSVMCGVLTEAKGGFVEVDRTKVELAPAVCDKNAQFPPTGSPPDVAVSVEAPFHIMTPIIGDILGSNLTLRATAEAQCLVVPAVTYPAIPAPVARFTVNPPPRFAPWAVTVNGSTSTAAGGATIKKYQWSFGATGAIASHTFGEGSNTITLTVTDSRGQTDSESKTFFVGPPAPPTCPTVDFTWASKAGGGHPHRMDLSATVSDGTGGWAWVWTDAVGVVIGNTQNLKNYDFPTGGPQAVSIKATKGSCSPTVTKTVPVP
jgi:hypothetical protein